MSYFNPALIRLGKVPSDTNFQVGKTTTLTFKFSREIPERLLSPSLEDTPRNFSFYPQRGNLKEQVGVWSSARSA